jgi:hypothetical protein
MLEKAMRVVGTLPPREQDALASMLLDELASEKRWARLLFRSQENLAELAEEAIQEHRGGLTRPMEDGG